MWSGTRASWARTRPAHLRCCAPTRAELIDPLVDTHGGRIVKTMGDGLLLEFPSVVAAVECAIAVQDGLAVRNQDVHDDKAIRLRIGVHIGDVIIEGDDIFGDGVNIAARIEPLSEPGAASASRTTPIGRSATGSRLTGRTAARIRRRISPARSRSGTGAVTRGNRRCPRRRPARRSTCQTGPPSPCCRSTTCPAILSRNSSPMA